MPVELSDGGGLAPVARPASAVAASARGLAMTAGFEGFRPDWYDDGTGTMTVGYGHTGLLPDGFRAPLTREQALELLRVDMGGFEASVRALDVHLTQQQFDALCDFAFNCGAGALQGGVSVALHTGRYGLVPGILGLYVHAGGRVLEGLVVRRRAEGELFAHGTYPAS